MILLAQFTLWFYQTPTNQFGLLWKRLRMKSSTLNWIWNTIERFLKGPANQFELHRERIRVKPSTQNWAQYQGRSRREELRACRNPNTQTAYRRTLCTRTVHIQDYRMTEN